MRDLTGHRVLFLMAAVFLFATVAVGVYGLVRGPRSAASPPLASTSPKAKVVTRYLSVLSYAVLKAIRPILFNSISEDQLRARYAIVGGVIRSIGQLYTEDPLIPRLTMAAGACTVQDLITGQGGHQKIPEVSDVLLHFIVNENDDTKAALNFASQSVSAQQTYHH